jgi:hypothetical protein
MTARLLALAHGALGSTPAVESNNALYEALQDEPAGRGPWVTAAQPCRKILLKTAGGGSLVFPLKAGNKPDRNGR